MKRTALVRRTPLRRTAGPKRRGGMKRDALDALWSRYIRTRDGFRCQWEGCQPTCGAEDRTKPCGRQYAPNSMGYHAAHVFSRGKQSGRLLPENGIGLCYPHHVHADHNKASCFHPWMKRRLGEAMFTCLQVQVRTPMTHQQRQLRRAAMRIWLTEQLDQLERHT